MLLNLSGLPKEKIMVAQNDARSRGNLSVMHVFPSE